MSKIRLFLTLLIFPILLIGWLIYWNLWGKKHSEQDQKRKEWLKKVSAHVRNFSPDRLKSRSWQISVGKYSSKSKKRKRKAKNKGESKQKQSKKS